MSKLAPWFAIAIVLLAAVPARAQETADDIHSLVRIIEVPDFRGPEATDLVKTSTSHELRNDLLFRSLSIAFAGAASADISLSMYQINRGTAREVGFGAQWQDSPVAFAVTKGLMATAFVYGLQRMHKTRPKTAFVLGLAATAVEGWLAARAAGMSQR